jgi:hypothetical protein
MIQHEVSIHLDCQVQQVFEFLADARNLRTWQSNLIENEILTGSRLGVGSRYREVRRLGRRPAEIRAVVTDFEPNKRLATKTETEPQVTVCYTFSPEGGGTRLNYQFMMQTSGMMRLFEPMITASIKKETEADFRRLKHTLEH